MFDLDNAIFYCTLNTFSGRRKKTHRKAPKHASERTEPATRFIKCHRTAPHKERSSIEHQKCPRQSALRRPSAKRVQDVNVNNTNEANRHRIFDLYRPAPLPCSAGMWYVHRGQASALACELIENKSFGLDFHIAGPLVPK